MAVIMEVFAWGGRIAARVLRGAADVVEGLVGMIDANLPDSDAPGPFPWDPPREETDPFERFRAHAAAQHTADSLSGRTGAGGEPDGGIAEPEILRDAAADGLAAEGEDLEGDDDEDFEDEQGEDDAASDGSEAGGEPDGGIAAGDDEFGADEDETEALDDGALDAGRRGDASAPLADGLDAEPIGDTTPEPAAEPVDREARGGEPTPAAASSFGEAFRSRGTLAPDLASGRAPGPDDDSAPRPGTRARIAEALDAARNTFESSRARRAFGSATIEPALGRIDASPGNPTAGTTAPGGDARRAGKPSKRDDETRRAKGTKKKAGKKKVAKAKDPRAKAAKRKTRVAAAEASRPAPETVAKTKKPKQPAKAKSAGSAKKKGRRKK